ncbi:MAG: Smr/MutS family protein, partial [Pseudomonadota bacterium]
HAAKEPPKAGAVRQELFSARREALAEVEAVAAPPALPAAPARPAVAADPRRLKAGDAVRLTGLDQTGVLLEDPKPGAESAPVSVGVAGVRVVVPLREMEPLPAGAKAGAEPPRRPAVAVQASAGDGLDVNLVGLTVEEALPKVDKALDQAILAGRPQLAIVHGVGTGRLKAAVREYLEHHPYVVGTRRPENRRGGAGVTVAELRS